MLWSLVVSGLEPCSPVQILELGVYSIGETSQAFRPVGSRETDQSTRWGPGAEGLPIEIHTQLDIWST